MDRLFIRGRLTAKTFDEAMDILNARVEAMGYRLKPGRTVKPAPVQPWAEEIWWNHAIYFKTFGTHKKE